MHVIDTHGETTANSEMTLGVVNENGERQNHKPFKFRPVGEETENEHQATEEERAEWEPVEDLLARKIETELHRLDPTRTPSPDSLAADRVASLSKGEKASARILELKRKQQSCAEMRAKYNESFNILSGLTKHIDLVSTYLEKSEVDLAHLENIESKSVQLGTMTANLTNKCQEMQATIDEQNKQISLLEAAKASGRKSIGLLKSQYAHLIEENKTLASDLSTRQASLIRQQSDNQSMMERIDAQTRDINDFQSDINRSRELLTTATISIQQKDKEILELSSDLHDIKQRYERSVIDQSEIRSKYSELKSQNMEFKTELEEVTFELGAARTEFEEKLRLKEKRILELESRLDAPHVDTEVNQAATTEAVATTDETDFEPQLSEPEFIAEREFVAETPEVAADVEELVEATEEFVEADVSADPEVSEEEDLIKAVDVLLEQSRSVGVKEAAVEESFIPEIEDSIEEQVEAALEEAKTISDEELAAEITTEAAAEAAPKKAPAAKKTAKDAGKDKDKA